jgi:excisionase family DNA binding protein
MPEMLTAKDMQELLKVDRSTIYRMAEAGRLPAIKVGKQWRFPEDHVALWFKAQTVALAPPPRSLMAPPEADFASLLPLECVQLIQDAFAEALDVMLVITDMEGNPITEVSHRCGLFAIVSRVPDAVRKCVESWHTMGEAIEIEPRFVPDSLGLLCARGLVRVGTELKGMVVVGGIAPDAWPPSPGEVQATAAKFGIDPQVLTAHLSQVYRLDRAERTRILSFVQRIADVIAHIATERHALMDKLEAIAQLAR